MNASLAINGYELVTEVIQRFPNDAVERLLSFSGDDESYWLEFKAGMQLLPTDVSHGIKPEDLYWKITVAVISIMNTCGGAVFIGIDDKNHSAVDLRTNDSRHIIEKEGLEAYRRKEIYERINPVGGTWKTSKGTWKLFEKLPDNIEVRGLKYQEKDIAVILIKPCETDCVRVMYNDISEQLPKRVKGQIGVVDYIIGSKKMENYEKTREICPKEIAQIWHKFQEQCEKIESETVDQDILLRIQKEISDVNDAVQELKIKHKNSIVPQPQRLQVFTPQKQKVVCISDALTCYYMSSIFDDKPMDLIDISSNYEYFTNLISAYIFSIYTPDDALRYYQHPMPTFGTYCYRFDYAMRVDTKRIFAPKKCENYCKLLFELSKEISCIRFDTGRDFDDILNQDFRKSLKALLSFVLYVRNQYLHERLRILNYFTRTLSKIYVELIDLFQDFKITESEFLVLRNNDLLCLNSVTPQYTYKDTNSRTVPISKVDRPIRNNTVVRQVVKSQKFRVEQICGFDFVCFEGGTVSFVPSGWKNQTEDFVKPFAISKYPITNRQFLSFLRNNPDYYQKCLSNPLFLRDYRNFDRFKQEKLLDAAVYFVGWNDAAEFCNYLSSLAGRPTAYKRDMTSSNSTGFRLPSEAEWVYALTGGSHHPSIKKQEGLVCRENRIGLFGKVVPNATLSANDFGVCGMLGNINEWTNTDATIIRLKNFEKNKDQSKSRKIIKGGSFASSCRIITPDYATDVSIDNLHYIGFRIAFSID